MKEFETVVISGFARHCDAPAEDFSRMLVMKVGG